MKQDTQRKLLAVAKLWGLVCFFFGVAVATLWFISIFGVKLFAAMLLIAIAVFVTLAVWVVA